MTRLLLIGLALLSMAMQETPRHDKYKDDPKAICWNPRSAGSSAKQRERDPSAHKCDCHLKCLIDSGGRVYGDQEDATCALYCTRTRCFCHQGEEPCEMSKSGGGATVPSRPLIQSLLAPGRPSAVAGLVIPVVVDTIDRETGRARAHVSEEVLERGGPTLTDLDPASAVIGIVLTRRSVAAIEQRAPASVFACPLSDASMAVRRPAFKFIPPKTPTAFSMAGGEIGGLYNRLVAAGTQAFPCADIDALDCRQAIELLTGRNAALLPIRRSHCSQLRIPSSGYTSFHSVGMGLWHGSIIPNGHVEEPCEAHH